MVWRRVFIYQILQFTQFVYTFEHYQVVSKNSQLFVLLLYIKKGMEKKTIHVKIDKVGKEDEHYVTSIDNVTFQKMMFIYNAINDDWSVAKKNTSYTFIKNHNGKSEVFDEDYLATFVVSNLDMNKLLSQ